MTRDNKLSSRDKLILLSMGYPTSDFPQIEEAIGKTKFILVNSNTGEELKNLSPIEAQRKLQQKDFLSGLGRSAFHWTSVRECSKTREIFFDSSALFKE